MIVAWAAADQSPNCGCHCAERREITERSEENSRSKRRAALAAPNSLENPEDSGRGNGAIRKIQRDVPGSTEGPRRDVAPDRVLSAARRTRRLKPKLKKSLRSRTRLKNPFSKARLFLIPFRHAGCVTPRRTGHFAAQAKIPVGSGADAEIGKRLLKPGNHAGTQFRPGVMHTFAPHASSGPDQQLQS